MKKTILCILAIVALALGAAAQSVVDRAAKLVKESPALTATFRLNGGDGRLVMSGARFRLEVPGMKTSFDGNTQYTLNEPDSELTLTTPTLDEIAAINPLAFIGNLRSQFSASTLPDGRVRFVPVTPGTEVDEIVATFDKRTAMPLMVNMKTQAGELLIDHIKVTRGNKSLPTAGFVIKGGGKITTIDLR